MLQKVEQPKSEVVSMFAGRKVYSEIAQSAMASVLKNMTDLYNNPIEATVRELFSNALDATKYAQKQGLNPGLITITTPTYNNTTYFVISDNGIGMSQETIEENYKNIGSSTKIDDLDQIGAFGAGAKAPLSYTDSFKVVTVYKGFLREFRFSLSSTGPFIEYLCEKPTDMPSGTTVYVPVQHYEDSQLFEAVIKQHYAKYGDTPFMFNGELVDPTANQVNVCKIPVEDNHYLQVFMTAYDNPFEILHMYIRYSYVLGGFQYADDSNYRTRFDSNITVKLIPGVVNFPASRDSIKVDHKLKKLSDTVYATLCKNKDDIVHAYLKETCKKMTVPEIQSAILSYRYALSSSDPIDGITSKEGVSLQDILADLKTNKPIKACVCIKKGRADSVYVGNSKNCATSTTMSGFNFRNEDPIDSLSVLTLYFATKHIHATKIVGVKAKNKAEFIKVVKNRKYISTINDDFMLLCWLDENSQHWDELCKSGVLFSDNDKTPVFYSYNATDLLQAVSKPKQAKSIAQSNMVSAYYSNTKNSSHLFSCRQSFDFSPLKTKVKVNHDAVIERVVNHRQLIVVPVDKKSNMDNITTARVLNYAFNNIVKYGHLDRLDVLVLVAPSNGLMAQLTIANANILLQPDLFKNCSKFLKNHQSIVDYRCSLADLSAKYDNEEDVCARLAIHLINMSNNTTTELLRDCSYGTAEPLVLGGHLDKVRSYFAIADLYMSFYSLPYTIDAVMARKNGKELFAQTAKKVLTLATLATVSKQVELVQKTLEQANMALARTNDTMIPGFVNNIFTDAMKVLVTTDKKILALLQSLPSECAKVITDNWRDWANELETLVPLQDRYLSHLPDC